VIVWFAESGVRWLSNDRVSRVMQTANIAEQQKSLVTFVGKQSVRLGDYCIFKNNDNDFLGNILSLASIEENSTRGKVAWEWDGKDEKSQFYVCSGILNAWREVSRKIDSM
jgi:hypothetical protein